MYDKQSWRVSVLKVFKGMVIRKTIKGQMMIRLLGVVN
jgi:hypothetical protein